jgi:hypothetical protein
MIAFSIAIAIAALFVAGAIAGGRRRRAAGVGYIAPRDLIKYK